MKELATEQLCKGKKVVLIAVPGAFTPTCSMKHLPGFIEHADEIKVGMLQHSIIQACAAAGNTSLRVQYLLMLFMVNLCCNASCECYEAVFGMHDTTYQGAAQEISCQRAGIATTATHQQRVHVQLLAGQGSGHHCMRQRQ